MDEISSSSMSEGAHSGMEESSLSWQPAQVDDSNSNFELEGRLCSP